MGGGCCIGDCCVGEWIADAINSVVDFFCSDGCGYCPGVSDTEAHAKKIADELAEMKEKIHKKWDEKEKEILGDINKDMLYLVDELDKSNQEKFGGKTLNIDIEGIKAKTDELGKKVIGCIGGYCDERLVLTDKELSVILEDRDDKKRADNFHNFVYKLQKESVQKLKDAITETIKAQVSLVSDSISTRMKEVNGVIQKETKEYEALLDVKGKSEHDAMLLQMNHIYVDGLCSIVLDSLE